MVSNWQQAHVQYLSAHTICVASRKTDQCLRVLVSVYTPACTSSVAQSLQERLWLRDTNSSRRSSSASTSFISTAMFIFSGVLQLDVCVDFCLC